MSVPQRTPSGIAWTRRRFPSATGVPLVCIHGLGCHAGHFAGVLDALGDRVDRVVLDLAGHGASAPVRGRASVASFADDVEAVLDAAGLTHAVLVGHSLGGAIAVEVAARHPDRIVHVVALDALLNPRVYPRQPAPLVAVARLMSRSFHSVMMRLLLRALMPAPRDPDLLADVSRTMLALPARVAADASASLAAWDRDAALVQATAPVSIIPAAVFARAAAAATLTPRCDVRPPIAGSHFFLRERPVETAEAIEAALAVGARHP